MKMAMTFWIPNMKLQNWKIYRKFGKTLQEILLCFIVPLGLNCLQLIWININQIKLTVKCLKSWPQPIVEGQKLEKIFLCSVPLAALRSGVKIAFYIVSNVQGQYASLVLNLAYLSKCDV